MNHHYRVLRFCKAPDCGQWQCEGRALPDLAFSVCWCYGVAGLRVRIRRSPWH